MAVRVTERPSFFLGISTNRRDTETVSRISDRIERHEALSDLIVDDVSG